MKDTLFTFQQKCIKKGEKIVIAHLFWPTEIVATMLDCLLKEAQVLEAVSAISENRSTSSRENLPYHAHIIHGQQLCASYFCAYSISSFLDPHQ